MANFALDTNSSPEEIVASLNYALATVGSGQTANALVANTASGTISNVTSGEVVGYLYQWINVRYADSPDGATNFSTSPTNRGYYGLRNTSTSTASSNPADYIWYQVAAGGFGTTKFLFYSSIGGNQIAWYVGTAAPNLLYLQTQDGVAIDLSIITTSIPTTTINVFYPQGQFIVQGNASVYTPPAVANVVTLTANVQAVRQNTITAAIDQEILYFTANGNYFISSNVATGFNANLFSFQSPYSSTYNVYQEIVYVDPSTTVTSFLSAALIVNNSTANVGPPGQRGSIPLGFVTTVNDPNTATSANLTAQFQEPRTNTVPPIGLGIGAPITNDTVQFFYPNLSAVNGGITSVRTWDGNVWTPVTADVVSGNVIYTGTITSQAMSTFDVFTIRIESTNSEIGNVNANGFWLDSISGDARFAGNTYIGNDLIVGNNAVIGANLTIGNNSVIGGNLSVLGLITQGSLANAVVTNASLQDGSISGIKIQAGTITGNLIAANTITGNLIQANTIYGNAIIANTLSGNTIIANTLFGNTIVALSFAANSINGDAIVANTLTVSGNIRSSNATVGNVQSPGYWLDSVSGDARFGGNTSIGNNLTVGNLITSSSLNANVITTNMLQVTSATQTINEANNTPYPQIQFVNGNAIITSPDYYWPLFTRGFAIGGGTTILTTTNGSSSGSKITVNYNAYIYSESNPEYNVVELWKSGTSPFYSKVFQTVRAFDQVTFYPNVSNDTYSIVGFNGAMYAGNIANITQVSGSSTLTYNLYDTWISPTTQPVTVTSGLTLSFGDSGATVFGESYPTGGSAVASRANIAGAVAYAQATGNPYPVFNIFGARLFGSSLYFGAGSYPTEYTVVVGSSGTIAKWSGRNQATSAGPTTGQYFPFGAFSRETTGVFADLRDIDADIQSNIEAVSYSTISMVAVGTSGTILYNTRSNFTSTATWSSASSPVIVNLNSVKSNYTKTTQGNTWVAVGDAGTILKSTSVSGPWVVANSVPTTNNLNAVGYTNGYWVAVGDAGTIIYSTDGSNWSGPVANPADGTDTAIGVRNLYGVAGGLNYYEWVAAGEEIIMRSNTTNPGGSWASNIYLGGSSVNTSLTRLQYFGSFANVANTSLPPAQQRVTNGQVVSGTYTDINYVENEDITYYLVLGNMYGNVNVFTNGPNMTITEFKR